MENVAKHLKVLVPDHIMRLYYETLPKENAMVTSIEFLERFQSIHPKTTASTALVQHSSKSSTPSLAPSTDAVINEEDIAVAVAVSESGSVMTLLKIAAVSCPLTEILMRELSL